jgi:CTP synthase (UTP-ammonia lyase)
VGVNPGTNLVEIVELKDHPWFVGVQYHPELKSTVLNPHPLFVKFVEAAWSVSGSEDSLKFEVEVVEGVEKKVS